MLPNHVLSLQGPVPGDATVTGLTCLGCYGPELTLKVNQKINRSIARMLFLDGNVTWLVALFTHFGLFKPLYKSLIMFI